MPIPDPASTRPRSTVGRNTAGGNTAGRSADSESTVSRNSVADTTAQVNPPHGDTGNVPPTRNRAPMVLVGRRGTMVCLVSGALLYVLACAFIWSFNGYQTERSDFIRAFELTPHLALPGPLLAVAGISLLTVGQLGLLAVCSRRAPVASRIAAIALLVQLIGFAADMGGVLTLVAISLENAPQYPAGVLESLAGSSGALQWIGLVYLAGWLVGTVALAVALFRSKATPWWVPSALLLAMVADMAGLHLMAVDFQLLLLLFAVGAAISVSHHADRDWHGE